MESSFRVGRPLVPGRHGAETGSPTLNQASPARRIIASETATARLQRAFGWNHNHRPDLSQGTARRSVMSLMSKGRSNVSSRKETDVRRVYRGGRSSLRQNVARTIRRGQRLTYRDRDLIQAESKIRVAINISTLSMGMGDRGEQDLLAPWNDEYLRRAYRPRPLSRVSPIRNSAPGKAEPIEDPDLTSPTQEAARPMQMEHAGRPPNERDEVIRKKQQLEHNRA